MKDNSIGVKVGDLVHPIYSHWPGGLQHVAGIPHEVLSVHPHGLTIVQVFVMGNHNSYMRIGPSFQVNAWAVRSSLQEKDDTNYDGSQQIDLGS